MKDAIHPSTKIYAFGDCHLPVLTYTSKYDVPKNYFDHLQNHLRDQHPEILLIAGDLFLGNTLEEIEVEMQLIRSLPGEIKFFVEGNHDLWFDALGSTYENAQHKAYKLFSNLDFYYIGGRAIIIKLSDGRKIGLCGTRGFDNNSKNCILTNEFIKKKQTRLKNLNQSIDQMQTLLKTNVTATNICLLHYPPTMKIFSNFRQGNEELLTAIQRSRCINKVVCGHVHIDPFVKDYTTISNLEIYCVVISNTSYESTKIF